MYLHTLKSSKPFKKTFLKTKAMPYLKQIVAVRRKAGLTKQEFFDYHFQVHGKISTAPSPAETPS
jgi:hypothetical protein